MTVDVDSWRGRASEEDAERTAAEGGSAVRLRAGSRALLGSLIRPHRKALLWIVVLLLLQSGAEMAGPYLVKLGIDNGIPPLLHQPRNHDVLIAVGIAFGVATVAAYLGKRGFVTLSGRVGQAILFDLRNRVYRHFQRLSVGFHERYTSGRMISRLTSDMDSISELLDGGVEDLVLSLLSVFSVAVVLLWLDVPLALVSLVLFPVLAVSYNPDGVPVYHLACLPTAEAWVTADLAGESGWVQGSEYLRRAAGEWVSARHAVPGAVLATAPVPPGGSVTGLGVWTTRRLPCRSSSTKA